MKRLWLGFLWAFDLLDPKGAPDFGKWAVCAVLVVYMTLLVWRGPTALPSLGHTITILSAAFGSRMFLAFLKAKAATSEERITWTAKAASPGDDV
jgi:hypothetical protein